MQLSSVKSFILSIEHQTMTAKFIPSSSPFSPLSFFAIVSHLFRFEYLSCKNLSKKGMAKLDHRILIAMSQFDINCFYFSPMQTETYINFGIGS